jgi:NAD(P)-dependent dehydrogenase (short-subunit alcohol dehydrogenase family)
MDHRQERAEPAQSVEEIGSPKLKTVVSDTSKLADISIMEKAITESGAKLDVLFLNAGIATFAPIEQATEADFDAQFNTNVKGHFFALQKLILIWQMEPLSCSRPQR